MAIKSSIQVWLILAKNILQNQLLTPWSSLIFILGKLFNFLFTLFTIFAIFGQTNAIHGYNIHQAVIFVILFNFTESFTQFFFRALYTFRVILIKGDFDMDLLKPLPSFFRPIFSGPDFLDVPLIFIQLFALIYFVISFHLAVSVADILIFIFLFINAVIVAFAVHLAIAAFAIITTEIDNLVMLYRNLGRAAVVPTDIYSGIFRFILDYIVPITLILSIPARGLLGLISPQGVVTTSILAYLMLFLSLNFWQYSLRKYTSAGS